MKIILSKNKNEETCNMNVKTARQDQSQNQATVAFIAVTVQLYVHQNKMKILAADKEGYAANRRQYGGAMSKFSTFCSLIGFSSSRRIK